MDKEYRWNHPGQSIPQPVSDIRRWILQGHCDDGIDSIIKAARDRKQSMKLRSRVTIERIAN